MYNNIRFSKNTTYFSLLLLILVSMPNIGCRQDFDVTPTTTAFVFNFDTLVVARQTTRTTFNSILAVLKHPWVLFLLLRPSFYRDIVHIITRNIYADRACLWSLCYYIDHFQKVHTLFTPDIKEALLQALNAYKPFPATLKIIAALKKSGYRVYMVTNKNPELLKCYIKPRLKKYYNIDLDIMFDGHFYDNARRSTQTIYTMAESLCKNNIQQIVFFDNNPAALERIERAHTCLRPICIFPENLQEYTIIQDALLWNKKDEKRNVNEETTIG